MPTCAETDPPVLRRRGDGQSPFTGFVRLAILGFLRSWLFATAFTWLAVAPFGSSAFAADDTPAEPVTLDYRAPEGCPARSDLEAQMRALSPRIAFATSSTRVLHIEVSEERTQGTLTVQSEGVTTGTRDVSAPTCEEVVDVLVFAAALVLDPSLAVSGAIPPAPSFAAASAVAQGPSRPLSLVAPVPTLAPRAKVTPGEARGESRPLTSWWLAAGATVSSGVSPNPTFGGAAVVGVSLRLGPLRPLFSLAAEVGASAPESVANTGGGSVSYFRAIGAFEGCPPRWPIGIFRVRACARFETGERTTSGEQFSGGNYTRVRPWLGLGASASVEVLFRRPFFFDLEGLAVVPLVRDTIQVTPLTVQNPVALSAGASFRVGVEFR
jgi:hypothetical protein